MTGNRSEDAGGADSTLFWSSVVLTGNRSRGAGDAQLRRFWSSVVLTGNRSNFAIFEYLLCFGVASF